MNLINDDHPTSGICLETGKPVLQVFPGDAMWERQSRVYQLGSPTIFHAFLYSSKYQIIFDKILTVTSTRDTIRFWRNISSRRRMWRVFLATHTAQYGDTMSVKLVSLQSWLITWFTVNTSGSVPVKAAEMLHPKYPCQNFLLTIKFSRHTQTISKLLP